MNATVEGLQRRGLARGLKISLDVLFYLTLVVAVVMRVGALGISSFTDYEDGWEHNVPVAVGEGSFYAHLPVEAVHDAWPALEYTRISAAHGRLRFLHYSLPVHLGRSAIALLFTGLFLWGLTLLRRILATTAGGRPFDPINPRRLNALGWLVLASSALATLLDYMMSKWTLSRIEITTVPLSPPMEIHTEWILCGLLVLVLAAIWKEAVQMAEEQSLTV